MKMSVRSAQILPGRSSSCYFSYYFALYLLSSIFRTSEQIAEILFLGCVSRALHTQ